MLQLQQPFLQLQQPMLQPSLQPMLQQLQLQMLQRPLQQPQVTLNFYLGREKEGERDQVAFPSISLCLSQMKSR